MGNPKAAETAAILRMLPSTDELLNSGTAARLVGEAGQTRLTSLSRRAIESVRKDIVDDISKGPVQPSAHSRAALLAKSERRLLRLWKADRSTALRRVINATGVVVHTNLGRAPLASQAVEAVAMAARYCTLEYDLGSGKRGKRGAYVENLLANITGAEAALVVNNCAAAAFAVLTVFAKGGETIVSRGELVEIGGDFRVPDVLAQSGSVLREVGTTNRTKLSDYEKAIGENTKIILRVHPSNYRIVGFTESPTLRDLSGLARRKGVLLYEDAGSGALVDLTPFGLGDEPLISRSIADGADIVTFSGDKLLGGCQAGLIVGRRDLIEQIRKHPLYRALRVDKLAYAALEATLELYARGVAQDNVPVLQMLSMDREGVGRRVDMLVGRLQGKIVADVEISVIDGESVVGGGSAPTVRRETQLIAIRDGRRSAEEIERRLRDSEAGTPVIARIEQDRVLIDLRTVDESDDTKLGELLIAALS